MGKTLEYIPADAKDAVDTFEFDRSETKSEFDERMQEFANTMRDLGDNSEILVKRQLASGKDPMEHVGSFQPDEYSFGQLLEHLRKNYGGGLYRIYLRAGGKTIGNSLVRIAAAVPSSGAPASVGGEVSQVVAQILGPLQAVQQQLLDYVKTQAAPVQASSRREWLEELVIMQKLFGGNGGGGGGGLSQVQEILDFLPRLGVTINGKTEKEEESFSDIADKFLPVVNRVLDNQYRQNAAQRPPVVPSNQPQKTSESESMIAGILFKNAIKAALRAAQKKSDPALYADLIIDQLGEEKVREYLNDPGFAGKLIKMAPEIAQFASWFDELIDHAKAMLNMPSTVAHLYSAGESDIDNGNDNLPPGEAEPEKPVNAESAHIHPVDNS